MKKKKKSHNQCYNIHNNLTQTNSTNLPQLIRIPNFNFDIRTKKLVNTGAAVSLVSCDTLFKLTLRTILGQELHSLGKYEFAVTINKDHIFSILLTSVRLNNNY